MRSIFCFNPFFSTISLADFLVKNISSKTSIITSKSDDLDKVFEKSKESHKKELEAIEKAHGLEIEKRDVALKRYQETMSQVEDMYRSNSKKLSRTKKKAVEKAIKENNEDPEAITKKLSELTGFKIHVE